MRFSVPVIGVAALFFLGFASVGAAQEPGWYSTAQADSGADGYYHRCAACHSLHLEGHKGPALMGSRFFSHFGGKKLSKLWAETSEKMPTNAPGSIPKPEAINIVAYVLRYNGLPGGKALTADAGDLDRVLPSKPPK